MRKGKSRQRSGQRSGSHSGSQGAFATFGNSSARFVRVRSAVQLMRPLCDVQQCLGADSESCLRISSPTATEGQREDVNA